MSAFLSNSSSSALPYSFRSFLFLPTWQTLQLALVAASAKAFSFGSEESFFTYLFTNSFLKASMACTGCMRAATVPIRKPQTTNRQRFLMDLEPRGTKTATPTLKNSCETTWWEGWQAGKSIQAGCQPVEFAGRAVSRTSGAQPRPIHDAEPAYGRSVPM